MSTYSSQREPRIAASVEDDGVVMMMTSSTTLVGILADVRSVLDDLELATVYGRRELEARVDLLTTATRIVKYGRLSETAALLALAEDVRDEAISMWRRHKMMECIVLAMMD